VLGINIFIMKTLSKLKIVLVIMLTAHLLSCKRNTSAPTTPKDQGTSTTGRGTGPGPSAKDSSTYDISSQTKNDTAKLGTKAKASKEKKIKK
jgi:hypothetical protein